MKQLNSVGEEILQQMLADLDKIVNRHRFLQVGSRSRAMLCQRYHPWLPEGALELPLSRPKVVWMRLTLWFLFLVLGTFAAMIPSTTTSPQ
jgi:hypothetical protein